MHHILNKVSKRCLPPTNRHDENVFLGTSLCPGCSLRGEGEPTGKQGDVQGLDCGGFWNIFHSAHKQKSIYWLSPEMLVSPPPTPPSPRSNQSLMSWDSDILASVFLTRRAVSRDAGLWAQHSIMSFPICLRHCGEGKENWSNTRHRYYYLISVFWSEASEV